MKWSSRCSHFGSACWDCLHGVFWDNMCPYRWKDVELLLLWGLPSACQQQLQEMPLHSKESNIWLAGNKTVASADHTNVMVANCQEACCQLIFSQTILQKILLCLCHYQNDDDGRFHYFWNSRLGGVVSRQTCQQPIWRQDGFINLFFVFWALKYELSRTRPKMFILLYGPFFLVLFFSFLLA